ncbi:hypothetical protein CJ030_MR2G002425 [Morella rubra]|uniref:F-box domain-containing protein n=1 Tax=Morella rubra TaxID=262757 RepID=A0A6A1WK77_9ROSI|nr:hypothetical protein CJ030_MR2G002425 [Morella rubra]
MPIVYGDWHELPHDLMEIILQRLNQVDRRRLSCVCKSWRSHVMQTKDRIAEFPWLLLPHGPNCKSFSFFSMSEGAVHNFKLPKTVKGGLCMGSSQGWLIVIKGSERDPKVFLYNPFSGSQYRLPSFTTIPSFLETESSSRDPICRLTSSIHKIVLSSPKLDECIVAATFLDCPVLAFCQPGDREWSVFEELNEQPRDFLEIEFCQDTLYAVEVEGDFATYTVELTNRKLILKIIPGSRFPINNLPEEVVDESDTVIMKDVTQTFHLVESDGEILIVQSSVDFLITGIGEEGEDEVQEEEEEEEEAEEEEEEEEAEAREEEEAEAEEEADEELLEVLFHSFFYQSTTKFEVFKIDCSSGNLLVSNVDSLGDRMLFVSTSSSSISLSARDFEGFSGNCIYFLADKNYDFSRFRPFVCRESGIFYLQNGRIERTFPSIPLPTQFRKCWFAPPQLQ